MKYVISRYNHKLSWIDDYSDDVVLYDRSDDGFVYYDKDWDIHKVKNLGSDWADKFQWIIDNYNDLPDVVLLSKANLFDYITPKEFEEVRFNTIFTPILTRRHKTYSDEQGVVCYYDEQGNYWERNNGWYLSSHPARSLELFNLLGMAGKDYIPFAPGSTYIVDRDTILKYPKKYYEKLRAYLDYTVYPGEAQIIERGIQTAWSRL